MKKSSKYLILILLATIASLLFNSTDALEGIDIQKWTENNWGITNEGMSNDQSPSLGTGKYSTIPVVNTYGFRTPGLLFLSTHQEFELTGAIVEFLQLPSVFNSAASDGGNTSHEGIAIKTVTLINSWQKYIEVAESLYTLAANGGGNGGGDSRNSFIDSLQTLIENTGVSKETSTAIGGSVAHDATAISTNTGSASNTGSSSNTGNTNGSGSTGGGTGGGSGGGGNTPPPIPTVLISANPLTVAYSGTSIVSWLSTSATGCVSSWRGVIGTGGIYTTPVLTGSMTYSIRCSGSGGTASGSVTVNVGPQPIHGACGLADGGIFVSVPTTNLCRSGTVSGMMGNGPWTWVCLGSNGGNTSLACSASISGGGSGGGGGDTSAPTTPQGLTVGSISITGAVLNWNSSTDNVGVLGYTLFLNGSILGNTGGTSLRIIGLAPSTTYTVMVRAYDAVGNTSGTSTPLTFTTLSLVPTLTFFGSPTSVAYSGSSTLIWSSTDTTRCLSSWGGAPGTGGTYITPALTTNTTYAISCTGTGGTATGSVVVSVGSAPIAGQNPILAGIAPGKARHLGVYNPPLLADCGKTAAGIIDYSRFNYNSDKKSMMMFGGGHATIPRTDVDVLNLTLSGLTWSSDYLSTPILEQIPSNFNSGNATWISTGHPTSRHSYDQTVYVPDTQELIILGAHGPLPSCGNVGVDGNPQGKVAHYNTNTKIWSMGADINWKFTYPAVEYDPISKKIILVSRAGMQIYDPISRILSQALSYNSGGLEIVQNLVYYPPNGKMYYMLNNGRVFEVTLNRTNFSLSTIIEVIGITGTVPPRVLPSTGSDAGETGFAYDSENQIIGGGVLDGVFYAYNPITKVWTSQVMESISTMTNIGSISASHVIDYDDFNKVFIFISLSRDPLFPSSIYSWNTWAYKYNGVTFNAPPTPPTISLTATPASVAYSGTSVITWTSTNSTSCTKSWGANGTGGAYTTPVLTTNTTYAISCTGSGGIATGSVTVGVGSAPIQPGGTYKYRNQSPYLFQTVSTGTYLSPLPAYPGYDYYADLWGPTYRSVDPQAGWQWKHLGGDWLDANLISQGTTPWASFGANAVAGSTLSYTYMGTDVTSLVQYVQTNSKWLAVLIDATGGPRTMAGINAPGYSGSWIDVTYTDGSTGVLNTRIIAQDYAGGMLPVTIISNHSLPVYVEFDRPTKPVASARLTMTVTQHWSGNSTIKLFLLDPPMNSEPVTDTSGLASLAGPLDSGIKSVLGIIGAQQFVDGSQLSDFVVGTNSNKASEFNYDPAIWGGTPDLTLWPHKDAGKWIESNTYMPYVSLVASSYSGEGFTPLAQGVGAMRLNMPSFPVVNGQEVTNNGRGAADLLLFMDESNFGRLDHIFVRYYVRMGTPYAPQVSDRKLILSNGVPRWTDMGGKMGIGPSHATSYGGVSGSSGGGYGWQMRQSWKDNEAGQGGPDEQGVTQGFHLYDYQSNNPTGYRYGTEQDGTFERWGQKGGLGSMMYAGQWYEIETELKLNTVFTGSNTYLPDGELRAWVDGKLVWEGTGMVFRTLPIYDPGYNPSRIRPARELGVKELWLNWFHGGQSENTYPRTMFYSNIAWGKSRIGKMQTQ